MRINKYILLLLVDLVLIEFAIGQIPIKKITENVLEFDATYNSKMNQNNYKKFINRWFVIGDMNNDNKQDIVLQAYIINGGNDATVNVFYNVSDTSNIKFKNDKLTGFFLRGNGAGMDVGDVNNDGKLDILAPTENYHGDQSKKPLEYYPKEANNSPDRLYIQNDSTFKEYVQPDTLNTINGRLIDTNGDGFDEFISANYTFPNQLQNQGDNNNLLFQYTLNEDKLKRDFIIEAPKIENV